MLFTACGYKNTQMPETTINQPAPPGFDAVPVSGSAETAPAGAAAVDGALTGAPDLTGNRLVCLYVSSRAGGLAIDANLNPDGRCNFNCAYCDVDRSQLSREPVVDVARLAAELRAMLALVHSDRMQEQAGFQNLPLELRRLRLVALSGDGEPTLSPVFCEAVETVVHVRALGGWPFFKLVLLTNASALDQPRVQRGLRHFTRQDEIWAKLDAGTQAFFERINRAPDTLAHILRNILRVAKERPVVIQSLFARMRGQNPPAHEVLEYVARLQELQAAGAQISSVQIYSANQATPNSECTHLSLAALSGIARQVREGTGLQVTVH